CADQVVWRDPDDAQGLAAGSFQGGLIADGEGVQRRGGGVHFFAVNPQMTGAQAAIGVGFKAQAGKGHEGAPDQGAAIVWERRAASLKRLRRVRARRVVQVERALITASLNAGMSSGLRLLIRWPSTTTCSSTHSAPAFFRSSISEGQLVMRLPLTRSADISSQPPWQITAMVLFARAASRTSSCAISSVRMVSELTTPPGSSRAS